MSIHNEKENEILSHTEYMARQRMASYKRRKEDHNTRLEYEAEGESIGKAILIAISFTLLLVAIATLLIM